MKIPQKPKNVQEILKKDSSEVFKLLENKELMELVTKYNNKKYLHWDEVRYRKFPKGINPEHVWALMKVFRRSQYRPLNFGKWLFRYVLLDEFQKKLHLLDTGAAGRLGSSLDSSNINGQRYIISSLMEEAIASSQLEGAATTRKIAKELLRYNKKPKTYSEKMIVNGYKTIQKIVQMKEKNITPEQILELHKGITEDTLKDKKYEGQFRDNNDVVVGDQLNPEIIYHQPTDYKDIPKLLSTLDQCLLSFCLNFLIKFHHFLF